MDTGLVAQYVVVGLAVVLSAAYVVRRQWPGTVRRMRGVIALRLMRDARPDWQRALGRRIAPAPRASGPDCDSGCGGCEPSARG